MKKIVISTVLLVFFFNAQAQKPAIITESKNGWQKIGETEASFKKQDESILVFGKDRFSSIKISVADGPLNIDRLQVFYEDGKMEEFEVRNQIKAGGESKAFTLKNPDLEISKVAFTYQSSANDEGDKANVILLGQMTSTGGTETYRDEARETMRDVKREAAETADDIERAANNADREVDQESNEAAREIDNAADNTGDDIDSAGNKVENKISQGVSKVGAEIADQRHETKVGPNNQVIYIDDNGKFYYVDRQGQQVYVTERQLKDKDK